MRKLLESKNGVELHKEEHGGKVWYNIRVIDPTKIFELLELNFESNLLGLTSLKGSKILFNYLSQKKKIDNSIFRLPSLAFNRSRKDYTPEYIFGNLDKISFNSPYPSQTPKGPYLGINHPKFPNKSVKFIHPEMHDRTGDDVYDTIIHESIHGEHREKGTWKYNSTQEEINTIKDTVKRLIKKGMYTIKSRRHSIYVLGQLLGDSSKACRILQRVESLAGLKGKKEFFYDRYFVKLSPEKEESLDPLVSDKDWAMKKGLWNLTDETHELKGFKELE